MIEVPEILKMVVLGLIAGVLSGVFGIGGGLIIVPALVLIFGFDTKMAVGTSLFVILLPTGLLGVPRILADQQPARRAWPLDRPWRLRRCLCGRTPSRQA